MLSRHERQRLTESDPVLAHLLRDGPGPPKSLHSRAGMHAVELLGVLLIALGAMTLTFSLIFMGILALVAAACMHITRSRHAGNR